MLMMRALGQPRQQIGVDHAAGFRGQRTGDDQPVGARQQFRQFMRWMQFIDRITGPLRTAAHADDFQTEHADQPRDFRTDAAQTNNQRGLAGNVARG